MNQKEFELIAEVLRDKDYKWRALTAVNTSNKIKNAIAEALADRLEAEYKSFDREKFLALVKA